MTIDQAVQQPQQQELKNYCDLVLKGGITSDVVYPEAICKLAVHYKSTTKRRGKSAGLNGAGRITPGYG
jgi:hypothetical protein